MPKQGKIDIILVQAAAGRMSIGSIGAIGGTHVSDLRARNFNP
jgi:hypothetical protein